jgi:hypothetical protein
MQKCTQSLKSTYHLSSLFDFLPFSLIKRPNPLAPFHLRVQVVFAPALYCIGYGGLKADEPRGLRHHQDGDHSFPLDARSIKVRFSTVSLYLFILRAQSGRLVVKLLSALSTHTASVCNCLVAPITLRNPTTYSRIRVTNMITDMALQA